ncbi:hypothetical protein A2716_03045 [candidate division WWE3 bacterium RIFCSPHIGHO2_01_FULL_40_23]|uniref:MalT-like TPR region domain-containing protein n=1 Tax=candidate division WWE3 bacterium RIFCSPLOWO2_01_FULL_41_18 TaxID=1802625 RepID=A0A1F4VC39_UNCKA|nr:MAG: hypothetical protein A2716_03045 [candidate division WWE3 bacterium RIFCSPHIGHO2_01_FULL_40_23]OGC54806.1 MAG: hypothetical protein A3A78_05000 [candidate division WWE3 bacterium RIFCSPLOWO2_01_FULL_41_18]
MNLANVGVEVLKYNDTKMNEKLKYAKKIMEEGWKAREALEFEKAEKLLNEALKIFEEEGDHFNLIEATDHLAYSKKLKGLVLINEGLNLSIEALKTADERGMERALPLRAIMSLANAFGNFEVALKYCEEALPLFDKSMPKADILSHKATFLLRTGHIREAGRVIDEALKLCEKNWEKEREPHRSIWKSKALLTKGLILYNRKKLKEAREYGEEAKKLAQKKDLKTRLIEINLFLDLFA